MTTTHLLFPEPVAPVVALTPKMVYAQERLFAVHHPRGQFLVLTGPAGAGKTVTALHLEDRINAAHDAGAANAFRAAYYVASDLRKPMNTLMMQRMLYTEFAQQVLQLTVPKDMRTVSVPVTMNSIAAGLRMRNIQMVFIDEAGHLPPSALDHLVTLINTVVTKERHPLTVVLVGMDDLPINLKVMGQVERRVADTVCFSAYDAVTTLTILQLVNPYFKTVQLETVEGAAVMEFLLSKPVSHGGLIGHLVPLVERAAAMVESMGIPFGIRALRLAHATTEMETAGALAAAKRAWADPLPPTAPAASQGKGATAPSARATTRARAKAAV